MKTVDSPHYEISSTQLADWLEGPAEHTFWSVDGDPFLTGVLSFPCFPDDLAAVLRKQNRALLLLDKDPNPEAKGQTIGIYDLSDLAFVEKTGDRVFQLCWKDRGPEIDYGSDVDWNLIEDKEAYAEAIKEMEADQMHDRILHEMQDSTRLEDQG